MHTNTPIIETTYALASKILKSQRHKPAKTRAEYPSCNNGIYLEKTEKTSMWFLDRPTSYRYCYSSCSCAFSRRSDLLQKSLRLRRFKSDRDEIWHDCSSSEYPSMTESISDTTSHFQDDGHDVILRKAYNPEIYICLNYFSKLWPK